MITGWCRTSRTVCTCQGAVLFTRLGKELRLVCQTRLARPPRKWTLFRRSIPFYRLLYCRPPPPVIALFIYSTKRPFCRSRNISISSNTTGISPPSCYSTYMSSSSTGDLVKLSCNQMIRSATHNIHNRTIQPFLTSLPTDSPPNTSQP